MRLSESFKNLKSVRGEDKINLDLTVKVFNINFKENIPILKKCLALFAYSKFSDYVKIAMSEGNEDPIGYALDKCISENLLSEYFERLKREDRGMIFGEYSYEDDIRVQRQEAFEDGEIAGMQQKAIEDAITIIKKYNAKPEDAARDMNAPLDKVLEALASTAVEQP